MLTRLDIRDFTIVESVVVEFASGFCTITGETGAGKSILLGALGLILGDRASGELVRPGATGADLGAEFDLSGIDDARAWLDARELTDPDAPDTCLLRRTLGADGRSRAFINGRPATLQDIRDLASRLIDIHSQHAHQSLLRRDVQRMTLDAFGGHLEAATAVREAWRRWHAANTELASLLAAEAERADRHALIRYQLEELDAAGDHLASYPERTAEQQRLAGAEETQRTVATIAEVVGGEDDSLRDRLASALALLEKVRDDHPRLAASRELLTSASVSLEEAADELHRYAELLEPDPARLAELDDVLATLFDLGRKHRVPPEQLAELRDRLAGELGELEDLGERKACLEQEIAGHRTTLEAAAEKLGKARARAAGKLQKQVTPRLKALNMEAARLEVALTPSEEIGEHGAETVELRIATQPGRDPAPLGEIASGGELSRVALAIQVVTAQTSRVPSLVLDEADVGIGGGTAEVVGTLLRELGGHAQILAVTHLPQVAAQGQAHYVVRKRSGKATGPEIVQLEETQRVEEIARMLGGVEITETTRAHAEEMLGG